MPDARAGDPLSEFAGRRVIVTGGTRGIGLAVAHELLARNAKVVVTGRDEDRCAEVQRRLSELGEARAVEAHSGDPGAAATVVGLALEAFGGLDGVVNNAAISLGSTLEDLDDAVMLKSLEVNLLGPARLIREAAPHLERSGRGSVVNILTAGLLHTGADLAPYHVSKGGLAALTRQLAHDLAPRGVRVNAVAPGVVATDLTDRARGGLIESAVGETPIGRAALPQEVALAVLFLLSEASSFCVGHVLVADGGLSL